MDLIPRSRWCRDQGWSECCVTEICQISDAKSLSVKSAFIVSTERICCVFCQMAITFDEQYLLTVSEDGCLLTWKIIDKEGRGLKSNRQIIYSEAILVTKLDMEEKVCVCVCVWARACMCACVLLCRMSSTNLDIECGQVLANPAHIRC